MPAPRPPILGLSRTGKRRHRAALDSSFVELITLETGYRTFNFSNNESCNAFEVSNMNEVRPLTIGMPERSTCAR